jgi:hypothetical protein
MIDTALRALPIHETVSSCKGAFGNPTWFSALSKGLDHVLKEGHARSHFMNWAFGEILFRICVHAEISRVARRIASARNDSICPVLSAPAPPLAIQLGKLVSELDIRLRVARRLAA